MNHHHHHVGRTALFCLPPLCKYFVFFLCLTFACVLHNTTTHNLYSHTEYQLNCLVNVVQLTCVATSSRWVVNFERGRYWRSAFDGYFAQNQSNGKDLESSGTFIIVHLLTSFIKAEWQYFQQGYSNIYDIYWRCHWWENFPSKQPIMQRANQRQGFCCFAP